MITAAPSLRHRPTASHRDARAALFSRLQLQGASRRAARIRVSHVVLGAGLLGCGLLLAPGAQAAPSGARKAVLAQRSIRASHVLAQLPRQLRLNPLGKVSFTPRASMPDFTFAPELVSIETPLVVTQSSAKQLRLSNRYLAQNIPAPRNDTPPRAHVMPKATQQFTASRFPAFPDSTFAGVQPLPGLVTPAFVPAAPAPSAKAGKRVAVVSDAGGGKMIQFKSSAQLGTAGTAKNNVSPLALPLQPGMAPAPAAGTPGTPLLPSLPTDSDASGPNSGMKKVIKVPGLSLPPLSQPLPDWMKSASVRVDRLEKGSKTTDGRRLAQNPSGAPVRQPAAPVTNSDRLSNQIEVATSTFVVLLTTTDLQTVAVADPSIADVAVVNSRSVLLNGKAPGITSLVIVDGQKIRQYVVRVTAGVGTGPDAVVAAIGIPGVTVRAIKDAFVLEGEVSSADEAKRAEEIASVYAPKVINQIRVRSVGGTPAEASMAQISELLADYPGVKARVAGDTVILSGDVSDPRQIRDAETIMAATGKKVVNLIQLPPLSVEQLMQSLGAVGTAPVPGIPGQLTTAAPISVRQLGGQLIIEGVVDSPADIDIAMSAAQRTGLPVVNRLTVRAPLTEDQRFAATVASAIGRPNITVRGTQKRIVLEGTVVDTNEGVLAEQVARGFAASVDNLLQTPSPIQVNVDVTIAEINSNDARALGVQYGSASLTNEIVGDGLVTRNINPAFNQGSIQTGNGFAGFGQSGPNNYGFIDPFRARLNFLTTNNRGRILSAPSTTVLSGRTATFQVGGQVPIPAISTVGAPGQTTAIVFKDYGILLDVVPNALSNGVVTLRVRTEVSQPDFANGVTPPGGGGVVPGFQRRSTVTEVTVPPNGILSLSGLIRSEDTKSESGVPILSKIPIIGSLFKSKDFRQNKTELVVFVRPRVLPNPLAAGQMAPTNPVAIGENSNSATQLGNPGISSFNGGTTITAGAAAGAGA